MRTLDEHAATGNIARFGEGVDLGTTARYAPLSIEGFRSLMVHECCGKHNTPPASSLVTGRV